MPLKNSAKKAHTMPKVTVLPHSELCPEGKIIENAPEGESICSLLLDNGIENYEIGRASCRERV